MENSSQRSRNWFEENTDFNETQKVEQLQVAMNNLWDYSTFTRKYKINTYLPTEAIKALVPAFSRFIKEYFPEIYDDVNNDVSSSSNSDICKTELSKETSRKIREIISRQRENKPQQEHSDGCLLI